MADLGPISNSVWRVLSAGSLAVWLYVLWSASHRRAPLDGTPHEPVAWQPLPVFATFLVALVAPDFAVRLGGAVGSFSLRAVQWRTLAMALQGVAVVGLLRIAGPLRRQDFGWNPASWCGDLAVGAGGFLASLMPVWYVNAGIEKLGLRGEGDKHLFLQIIEADSGGTILFWIGLSVVVLAPLAEELTYRVLLQGWCQSHFSPWMAIPFSATIFSLVHRSPDCFALFPLALVLGYVYYRRRSYLAVVAIHSLFNATNLAFAVLTKAS